MGKGIRKNVAVGIISAVNAGGGKPTIAGISALGDGALKSIAESVERELNKKVSAEVIDITVDIPHARQREHITMCTGDTLHQLSASVSCLTEHIEWACGGIGACSTCHVYVDKPHYDILDAAADDELDMLDLAWGVTDTSRLACQLKIDKRCNGMVITIPEEANNIYSNIQLGQ